MAIKILATGDIHIGKVSSSIHKNSDTIATKSTWISIVDYALQNEVDVVVLTGDIIDRNNRYYEAAGPLQNGFSKLKQANIPVYLVAGNHDFDVLPQLIRNENFDNVHLLGDKGTWEAQTFTKNGKSIQFIGWSFPSLHYTNSPLNSYDASILNLNHPTIGILHGDVGNLESQYAPMVLNDFFNKGTDIWFLGHIHKPQILNSSNPLVYYPGSPHALSPKEQGLHGPVLLTIQSKEDIEFEQIPLSPVRYETLEIDITGYETEEAYRGKITSEIDVDIFSKTKDLEKVQHFVYDIILVGQHKSIKEVKAGVSNLSSSYNRQISETNTEISVRKTVIDLEPIIDNMEELARESSMVGILAHTILELQNGNSTPFLEQIQSDWNQIQSIQNATVYAPLKDIQGRLAPLEEDVKHVLLKECNRILSELINQQQ